MRFCFGRKQSDGRFPILLLHGPYCGLFPPFFCGALGQVFQRVLVHLDPLADICFLFFIGPGPGFGPVPQMRRVMALEMHPNYNKGRAIVSQHLCPLNPPIWLSREDTQRVNELNGNINTYRSEWLSKFIVGQEPLSKWDEYVAGLKKLGIDEVIALANKGYDNYLKAVGKTRPYSPPPAVDTSGVYEVVGIKDEYNPTK